MSNSVVRVLVVDDSALIRSLLRSALSQHPSIEVVGIATDGLDALGKIKALRPDVVTLDVEMPRLNGIGVLQRLAGKIPTRFLMVSSLTQSGGAVTFEALNRGAVDYIGKPTAGDRAQVAAFAELLRQKVLSAARARFPSRRVVIGGAGAVPTLPPNNVRGWVVAIGISCGGPPTLHKLLPAFPSDFVPIVITQHMPAAFTPAFAKHLDAACAMKVCEARDGEPLKQGTVYIAPGSHHLLLERRGTQILTRLDSGALVSGHRPSADVMMASVARTCGARAVGVIMTGMGSDGAAGLVEMSAARAHTIAQDEETSYVYGMPQAAARTGRVDHILPLQRIPVAVSKLIQAVRLRPQATGR